MNKIRILGEPRMSVYPTKYSISNYEFSSHESVGVIRKPFTKPDSFDNYNQ